MSLDAFETTGSSPGDRDPSTADPGGPSSFPAPDAAPAAGNESLYTDIIHGGLHPDPATGAILTPVYQTTTYVQDAVGEHKGFTYTRCGNPTVAALERNLGEIEGVHPALCFATGMAATSTLFLGLLNSGDHVVISDVVYGGTVRLVREILENLGVVVSFVDTSNIEAVDAAINSRTRFVFIESPANPTLKLTDIAAVADVVQAAGVLLVVDNTFLTAVLQNAFGLGADVVLYSTTKYIEGHNSTVGGALLARGEELLERLRLVQGALGNAQSPWEAWLTLRGLKTLPMRLERHGKNATAVAEWLEQRAGVTRVTYPWLDSFPQLELARRQQKTGGGMLTFEVEGGHRAGIRVDALAEAVLVGRESGRSRNPRYPLRLDDACLVDRRRAPSSRHLRRTDPLVRRPRRACRHHRGSGPSTGHSADESDDGNNVYLRRSSCRGISWRR